MISKHDNLCGLVAREMMERNYNYVRLFTEYKNNKVAGEIDVYAGKEINGRKYVSLFEIKSSDKYKHKATKQLLRAKQYFFNSDEKVFMFYVHPDKNNKPIYTRIRR